MRLAMVGQIAALSVLLSAAHHNYPGGAALERLVEGHLVPQLASREAELRVALATRQFADVRRIMYPIFVHIDVAAATSGVTRWRQTALCDVFV